MRMRYAGDAPEMRQRCVSHSYVERCVGMEEMGFAQDFGKNSPCSALRKDLQETHLLRSAEQGGETIEIPVNHSSCSLLACRSSSLLVSPKQAATLTQAH